MMLSASSHSEPSPRRIVAAVLDDALATEPVFVAITARTCAASAGVLSSSRSGAK